MKNLRKNFVLTLAAAFFLTACGTDNGAADTPGDDQNMQNNTEETGDTGDMGEDTGETPEIEDFELEIDFENNDELDMEYEDRGGSTSAEIERETAEGKEEISGEQALTEIRDLLDQAALHPDMSSEEAVAQILAALDIAEEDVRKLELEVDFTTGDKLTANL
ncbi:YusW family protein [Evansella clarkii]|uniref:YusW family protein n=1 Tax=Evansella clarkii TaxID=79879 RepID=UPI0009968AA2|nr:YusW family protein [Evansella clarkii]